MRVVVNWDECETNALCVVAAPEVFEIVDTPDGAGELHVLIERPSEELRAKVEEAVRMCPKTALSIAED